MATWTRFEEIEAWQKARRLTHRIYQVSATGALSRDFGLRDQMRRASVSIMSNIAEGAERDGKGELVQFLSMAKGSAGEVRAQLYVALDQRYLDRESFDELHELADEVGRMIGGLIRYLRSSNIKGSKFRNS